jgi:hypothetical protein
MPCKKCKDDKYKWGNTGECKYATKDECEKANPKKYNKMKNRPTPLGKKSYEEYAKELKEYNLSKPIKIHLSRIDDIEDVINGGLGLTEFVEEALDEAFTQFIKAKDIVRFDMNDSYTEGEGMLDEFLDDIKDLGLDVPAEVKQLQKNLEDLGEAIKDAEQRIKDF